jgi:hypothetical protein
MSDPHVLGPGLAPTPFTAEEIRGGCPQGRLITLLVQPADGPDFLRINHFAECDADGAVLERARLSPEGSVVPPVARLRVTWLELQRHAAFPADETTIERDHLDLPFGTLDCLRYTVSGADDVVFWFARTLPGMPVRYAGDDETVTMVATELRADASRPPADVTLPSVPSAASPRQPPTRRR